MRKTLFRWIFKKEINKVYARFESEKKKMVAQVESELIKKSKETNNLVRRIFDTQEIDCI